MINDPVIELTHVVRRHVGNKKFSLALKKIQTFVETIIADAFLDGLVLNVKELDALCLSIGREALQSDHCQGKKEKTNTILYIATELYSSGGHTAVLEDFIRAQPDCSHVVLLTNLFSRAVDLRFLEKRFANLPVKFIGCAKNDLLKKLIWLSAQWMCINPDKVFLFNHHQDVVAIAAAQSEMPGKLFFFHHSDYQLTLGMHLPHAVHIDFYEVLYRRCREVFGIKNNVYYPLVVADGGCKVANDFMADKNLHTCSSGSMGKYDKPYLFSYIDLLPQILKATNGVHTHIGYLSDSLLEKIKKSLTVNQISQDRFIYIPWVNNLWSFLLKQHVDLYIASFPIGGGRAAVEAMGAGIPIVFHNNYRAPFLGGAIQYPGAFFWREVKELLAFVAGLNKEMLIKQSLAARQCYEQYHRVDLLQQAIAASGGLVMNTSASVMNAKPDERLLLADTLANAVMKDVKLAEIKEDMFLLIRLLVRRVVKLFRG